MKALHRILVTGTISGLALLSAASSGALACTANAEVFVLAPGTDTAAGTLQPGDEVDIKVIRFYDGRAHSFSDIEVVLRDPANKQGWWLTTIVATPDVATREGVTVRVSLPMGLPNELQSYNLLAIQLDPKTGVAVGDDSEGVTVWDGPLPQSGTTTPTKPPSTGTTLASPPLGNLPPDQGIPVPDGATPGSGGTKGPADVGAIPPANRGGALAFDQTAGASGLAERLGLDDGGPPPEDRRAPVVGNRRPPQPADSLWSGLDGGDSPSLLETTMPPSDRDGGRLGAILLGAGATAIALTGLGTGLGRRRLSLGLIARR